MRDDSGSAATNGVLPVVMSVFCLASVAVHIGVGCFMTVRDVILIVLAAYVGFGVLFALWFVLWGVKSVDAVAAKTPLPIRIIWIPGAAIVWPLLLAKSRIVIRGHDGEKTA